MGGLITLVADGRTGILIEPEDDAALAQAIMRLLKDPVKTSQLGAEARKFIVDHYSSERMVHQTLNFYQKIILS